ncbi:MAG: DUF5916 domain-containing protein [Gemmatimonadota bacterium]|jgi:hypothetical protein
MILGLLGAFQLAVAQPPTVYNARDGHTSVQVPSVEAEVTVDGVLDEPVWRAAAILTGFSEYQPVDQRPSPDSTAVLVWYSRTAIYFGVRAFEPHGSVRATLADRDKVGSDDNTEIQLDTYNERNRAFVFIVNPLGVQADGTKSEGGGFIPGANIMPGQNDLSADFIWESKGRITDQGYEVEIRIPFSSLRYPTADVQDWGIQIQRNIQHSGYQITWTEARKAAASFIDQEGLLVGLTGMHHGQVVELNPELTNTVTGAPCCDGAEGGWRYDAEPRLGGNVRWAMGSNFVLNGTMRPDFSQVEADATQIAADERFALFYPERRPFFVEGVDQFNVPNTLIYTRAIVRPDAAMKLTGKVGRTDVAVMSALDDPATTPDGGRPVVDIVRLRRGFGAQSTAGLLYSERVGGGRSNRVVDADVHYVFGRLYYAQVQGVMSRTTQDGLTHTSPMWEAVVDRTGRSYGFHYGLLGIGPDFAADNGFVRRSDIVQANVANRFTAYGARGALLERYNVFVHGNVIWHYDDFFQGKSLLEDQLSARNEITLRGGWSITVSPTLSSYAFDPGDYADIYTGTETAPVPFVPSDRIGTFLTGVTLSTPQYQTFSATMGVTAGRDVDFFETARVSRLDYDLGLDARPTRQLRVGITYRSSRFERRSDGERTAFTRIPRLKVEYQITRSIFTRVVAQYTAERREALRDPRTGQVLLVADGDGGYAPSGARSSNVLRADWLFSYRPTPGTVVFAGYGNTLTEPDPLALDRLRRVDDAFFVKLSYRFRAVGTRR